MIKEKPDKRKLLPPRAARQRVSLSPETGVVYRAGNHSEERPGGSWCYRGQEQWKMVPQLGKATA